MTMSVKAKTVCSEEIRVEWYQVRPSVFVMVENQVTHALNMVTVLLDMLVDDRRHGLTRCHVNHRLQLMLYATLTMIVKVS